MRTTLTKIGNSKGVIIPARFLKECQFNHTVCLEIKDGSVVISSPKNPREGWKEAFAKAVPGDDARVIDDTLPNVFDEEEWTW